MSEPADRLSAAIRKLTRISRQGQPPVVAREPQRAGHDSRDSRDWRQFIESELDSMNRRLSAIESRLTIVFYLVVILTVVVCVTDASAARQIVENVLKVQ